MAIKRKASMSYAMASFRPAKSRKVLFKARRRKQIVKGPVKPVRELNYVDVAAKDLALTEVGSTQANALILLNGIAEGDDNTDRNGRKAKIVSSQLQLSLKPSTFAGDAIDLRVVLIWDNAPNGALPTWNDVFEPATAAIEATLARPLVNNSARFTILTDDKGMVSGSSGGTNAQYPKRYAYFTRTCVCIRITSQQSVWQVGTRTLQVDQLGYSISRNNRRYRVD